MPALLPRLRRLVAAAAALAALASCGGGTQIDPFVPERVIAFGDELSAFTDGGRKYAINGFATDGTPDCKTLPLWIQVVASYYGSGFPQCPAGDGEQKAVTYAAAGAGSVELVQQIDAAQKDGRFDGKVLALVLVGMNDVLELYGQFPALSQGDLEQQARQRGEAVGKQINRLIDLGARVIVSTTPDMGVTPYARSQDTIFSGSARAKLLSSLSSKLNGGIRTTFLNDGRFVGLVLADEYTESAVKNPSLFGLVNVKDEACLSTAPLPDCSSLTLVDGAGPETWMWADSYRLATNGHRQLGSQAESRVRSLPF